MTMKRFSGALVLAAALLIAPVLTACGKTGELERPGPMWGPDERDPADRAKDEADRRAASQQANKAAKPGGDQEVRDPASSTANIRQQPIAGTNDPFGKPPQ